MPDWENLTGHLRAEIAEANMTRSDMLRAIKEGLREIRLSLPNYRAIQEERRYQLTLSDVEDAELMYQQYMNDSAGIFEDEDYEDTLVLVRSKLLVITDVLDRFSRGEWQTPRD